MKAIRHFGMVVRDIEASLHFYRDLLGLKIQRDILEEGEFIDTILKLKDVQVRTVKMASDNGETLVELLEYGSHKGNKIENYQIFDLGASHIAFTVENVEAEYHRLLSEGITFTCLPRVSPDKKAKVTFCFDPDGVPVELVEVLQ